MADRYLEFVQETARGQGKEFFIDSGEGNDWGHPDEEWYVEDLSGWLVERSTAESFRQVWESDKRSLYGRQEYCFVHWTLENNPKPGEAPVSIKFDLAAFAS
jgi:hypothetical protein